MEAATRTAEGYCPHCELLVEKATRGAWPPRPLRCPHCHLLIGAGRGHAHPSDQPGTKGTAAGVFSREAARQVGERPERLLMVDYQQLTATDPGLPPLSDVFAAFGGWKAARREAAR